MENEAVFLPAQWKGQIPIRDFLAFIPPEILHRIKRLSFFSEQSLSPKGNCIIIPLSIIRNFSMLTGKYEVSQYKIFYPQGKKYYEMERAMFMTKMLRDDTDEEIIPSSIDVEQLEKVRQKRRLEIVGGEKYMYFPSLGYGLKLMKTKKTRIYEDKVYKNEEEQRKHNPYVSVLFDVDFRPYIEKHFTSIRRAKKAKADKAISGWIISRGTYDTMYRILNELINKRQNGR